MSSGRPVAAVLHIANTEQTIAVQTRQDGTFAIPLDDGEYRVVVASTVGSWSGGVRHPGPPLRVEVDTNCAHLTGRITGDAPDGTIVWFESDVAPYDRYGAAIKSAQYDVCVPPGEFIVQPDDGFKTLPARVVAGNQMPDLSVFQTDTIVTPPTVEPLRHDRVDDFVATLPGDARLIAIGESNHGTAEFLEQRWRVTEQISKDASTLIMLEASAGEVSAIDRYVHGGQVSIREATAKLRYWMWDTEEFLTTVEHIRARNKKRPRLPTVQLVGIDVQSADGAIDLLTGAARKYRWRSDELQAIRALREKKYAAVHDMDKGDLGDAERAANKALTYARKHDDIQLALAAKNVLAFIAISREPSAFDRVLLRERYMAEMIDLALEVGRTKKAVLWAHSTHVSAQPSPGVPTLGELLRARYGTEYFVIAELVASGSARAWDHEQRIGVIVHALESAPAFVLETVMLGANDVSYVTLREQPGQLAYWLRVPRYLREFGSIYYPGNEWSLKDTLVAFDGLIVVREGHPTTATETGIRTAKPAN